MSDDLRSELVNILFDAADPRHPDDFDQLTDRILALVQPAAGITLTPEEAANAAALIRATRGMSYSGDPTIVPRLLSKLEAAS